LNNFFLQVNKRLDKIVFLAQYVIENRDHKIIVFFNTCDSVDFYFKLFQRYIGDRYQIFKGYYLGKIHGEMKQQKRMSVFNEFGEKESGLLFATDVIARGIDFEKVDSIIQIDLPQDPNFYIHRIGRTARQGKQGRAIVVIDESESPYIDYLKEKLVALSHSATPRTLHRKPWSRAEGRSYLKVRENCSCADADRQRLHP